MPERPDARRDILDKGLLTMLLSSDEGHNGPTCRGRAMERLLPHAHISNSSRRRLARWLVGSPIRAVERELILETLAHTPGNRTAAARRLGISARTLRNRIAEYSAESRIPTNQPVTATRETHTSCPVGLQAR